jgi:fumarylpyruvate hydrolase
MPNEAAPFSDHQDDRMKTVFAPPEIVVVPVAGSDAAFPVRHVYCVGRNYAEHTKEMGGDTREPPFFFTKPFDAIVPVVSPGKGEVAYPLGTRDLHHELELVVAIGKAGVKVAAKDAGALVFGYAVGLDLTRRDLQAQMKEKRWPWDIGKSFAQAAPISSIHPVAKTGLLARGAIWLDVNGKRRQQGDLSDMIWDVAHTLHFLSQYYELLPGDLVFTGTPAGVAAVVPGDELRGGVDGVDTLSIVIRPPRT